MSTRTAGRRRLHRLGASIALALFLSACGPQTYQLRPDPRTPASIGMVKASGGENENLSLTMTVQHLPEPATLAGDLKTFVVWLKPASTQQWFNLGQVNIDKDRSGSLETKTAYKSGDVKVTAEVDGAALQPSEWVVLQGSIPPK